MNIHRTFTVVIFFLAIVAAHGQDSAFGLKAGINLATMDLNDTQATYDSRTGYHAGVFVRGKFGKVGLQPELLLFTQKGDVKSATLGTYQNSFTYVSVPVMLKFYPVAGLNLQLGPQFGFLVDGEQKRKDLFGQTRTYDIKDSYKSSDVSVSVGGGYDFGFGLGLDVRYNIGVKDINNVANGEPAKSRVFLVSLGWNFLK